MGDLGKLIVSKGFKNLPKVQKIAHYTPMPGLHLALLIRIFYSPGKSLLTSVTSTKYFATFVLFD